MGKLLLITLLLSSFLFAKDNFIYEEYHPTKIEKRLASIEKELRALKNVSKAKAALGKSAKSQVTVATSSVAESNRKELKRLRSIVWQLQKEMKSAKGTSKGGSKGSSAKLVKKVAALEKKIARMKAPTIGSSNKHESMRVDILDEKISNLEKKMNMLRADVAAAKGSAAPASSLLSNEMIEYVIVALGFIFLLLFAMIAGAMSRSKEAIKVATRVAEANKPKSVKKSSEPKKEEKKEEPVTLKTEVKLSTGEEEKPNQKQ